MSKKTSIKPLSIALGAAFVTSLAASNIAGAAEQGANPFAMNELSNGYMVAKEGSCGGSMKDGKNMKKKDGSCGGDMKGKKGKKEGSCGGDKDKHGDMKGHDMKGKKEGKCGEGKCGGDKKGKK